MKARSDDRPEHSDQQRDRFGAEFLVDPATDQKAGGDEPDELETERSDDPGFRPIGRAVVPVDVV